MRFLVPVVVLLFLLNTVVGLDSRWKLIWGDEFTSSTLDTTHWTAQTTTTVYNGEAEWYTASNVYIQNGKLVLKTNPDSTYAAHPYASGKVITQNKFLITRARVEVYGKLPYGQGIWPAYWLLSNDGCDNSEVDIMEVLGSDMKTTYGSWHYATNCAGPDATDGKAFPNTARVDFSADYHLYSVEINQTHLVYAVDNNIFLTTTANVSAYDQQPHYLILNTAVGGATSWGGAPNSSTVFPQYNYIDYVRVYGWQPCVTGCGSHGCCDQASQTCKCDSNYAGTNCEWQTSSSGTKAVCPTTTTTTTTTAKPTTTTTTTTTAKPTTTTTTTTTAKPTTTTTTTTAKPTTTTTTAKPTTTTTTAKATTTTTTAKATTTTGSTTGATTPLTMTAPSVAPSIAFVGSALTAKVTLNTGSTNLANGWVGYYIAHSNEYGNENQIAFQTDAITAAPNTHTTKTWTYTLSAGTPTGTYWLTIACWDANWNTLFWQTNQSILTVTPATASIALQSFAPSSAFPGSSVTAKFKVNLGPTGVTSGHVLFYLGPPDISEESQKIAQGGVDGQTLAAGSSTAFTISATVNQGTAPGVYQLYAGVWDANWNNVVWANNLATLTVVSPTPSLGPFSSSKTSVARGSSLSITMAASAGSTTLTGAFIGYGIVPSASANTLQIVGQQSTVDIAAGTTTSKTYYATIPASAAVGTYRVTFGLWDHSWNNLAWENAGLTINVY